MSESEFDYEKEYINYIINHNLFDNKKNKLKKRIYDVHGYRNQKIDEETGAYYGVEEYIIGFTTKPPKQEICQYCFDKLKDRHRKFCSLRCTDLYNKLGNKVNELGAEGIYWNENKDREIPNQKDMIVTYRGENNELFIDYDDGVTTKSGKQLPRKNKESKEFASGKDY
jgi:hypothetical protein